MNIQTTPVTWGVKPEWKRWLKTVGLLMLLMSGAAEAANPKEFTVPSATGKGSFTLSQAKGRWVVLHFLLKTECPVCLRYTQECQKKAAGLGNVTQVFLKPDTDEEIRAWASKLPPESLSEYPIYQDAKAALAKAYGIPDGYAFHGQTVHFPAVILLGPDGTEVFRYVGKNNSDRYPFEKLKALMPASKE